MAIPGLKATFDVKAKVRIGEKRKSRGGKDIPASVDYFLCDDPDFASVVGGQSKRLSITFPAKDAEDNFSTGLEWWQGKLLCCYAKGEEQDGKPTALRKATMEKSGRTINLLEGAEVLSQEVVGNDRRKIVCPVRECPILKRKDCKPMGRLLFYIEGIDQRNGVFQLDTKSWNSIENLEKTLARHSDLRGVPFTLRVEFTSRGTSRFPELYLEEAVEINSAKDAKLADALVQLRGRHDESIADGSESSGAMKAALAAVLDLTSPGWREREDVIERLKADPQSAAAKTLERYGV